MSTSFGYTGYLIFAIVICITVLFRCCWWSRLKKYRQAKYQKRRMKGEVETNNIVDQGVMPVTTISTYVDTNYQILQNNENNDVYYSYNESPPPYEIVTMTSVTVDSASSMYSKENPPPSYFQSLQ